MPGFGNEWYGKWMHDPAHEIYQRHVETFGSPADYGYTRFIDGFRAEQYDPDEWAELFHRQRRVVTPASRWRITMASVCGTAMSTAGMLEKMGTEARSLWRVGGGAAGARFALGRALPHHTRLQLVLARLESMGARFSTNTPSSAGWRKAGNSSNPAYADFYWVQQTSQFNEFFAQEWQLKVREVIDKYQPDMMWFDGGKFREDGYEETALEILAHYSESSGRLGERGAGAE